MNHENNRLAVESDDAARDALSLGGRLRELRSISLAIGVSFLLHLTLFAAVYLETGFRPPLRIEFEESRGVALMTAEGRVPEGADDVAEALDELPVTSTEQEDADRKMDSSEIIEEEPASAEPEEAPEPDVPDVEAAPEPEPIQPDPEPAPEAPARPSPASPEPAPDPEPEAADEADESGDDDVDTAQPPSARYPEGTLNPVATDVGMWGPEGARLVVILRNDRIRASVHRESVSRALASFPDWSTLLGSSSLDPIDDVDTLLIASSDPRYVNRTFLAAVHTIPPAEITRVLSEGFPGRLEWEERDGRLVGDPEWERDIIDPRLFVIPTDNVFVFSRPEYIAPLLSDAPAPVGLESARDVAMGRVAASGNAPAEQQGRARTPNAAESGESPHNAGAIPAEPPSKRPTRPGALIRRGIEQGGQAAQGLESVGDDDERTAEADEASGDDSPVGREGASPGEQASPGGTIGGARSGAPDSYRVRGRPPVRSDGWMDGILKLAEFGGPGTDGPAVIVSTGAMSSFAIQGMDDDITPKNLHASITADTNPVVRVRLLFDEAEDAETFRRAFPDILRANQTALRFAGLAGPLDEARVETDVNEVQVTFVVPERILRRLAVTVERFMGSK